MDKSTGRLDRINLYSQAKILLGIILCHPQGRDAIERDFNGIPDNLLGIDELTQTGRTLIGAARKIIKFTDPTNDTMRGRIDNIIACRGDTARTADWQAVLRGWRSITNDPEECMLDPDLRYGAFNNALANYSCQARTLAKTNYKKELDALTMREALDLLITIHQPAAFGRTATSPTDILGRALLDKIHRFKSGRPTKKTMDCLIEVLNSGQFESAIILSEPHEQFNQLCISTLKHMLLPQDTLKALTEQAKTQSAEVAILFLYENLGVGTQKQKRRSRKSQEITDRAFAQISRIRNGRSASIENQLASELCKRWEKTKTNPIIQCTTPLQVRINGQSYDIQNFHSFIDENSQMPKTEISEAGYKAGLFNNCDINSPLHIQHKWKFTRNEKAPQSKRFILATIHAYCHYAKIIGLTPKYSPTCKQFSFLP